MAPADRGSDVDRGRLFPDLTGCRMDLSSVSRFPLDLLDSRIDPGPDHISIWFFKTRKKEQSQDSKHPC